MKCFYLIRSKSMKRCGFSYISGKSEDFHINVYKITLARAIFMSDPGIVIYASGSVHFCYKTLRRIYKRLRYLLANKI